MDDAFGVLTPCDRCGNKRNQDACLTCGCGDEDVTIRHRRVRRGDSWFLYFTIVRDLTTQQLYTAFVQNQMPPNAVVVDITGWTIWVTVKRSPVDPDSQAVAQLKTAPGSGVTLDQPTSGKGHSIMPASATLNYPDGTTRLYYDVQAKDTNGNVYTPESGTLKVDPDITRAIA